MFCDAKIYQKPCAQFSFIYQNLAHFFLSNIYQNLACSLSFKYLPKPCVLFFLANSDPTHLTWQVTSGFQGYCFILCAVTFPTRLPKMICLAALLHSSALCAALLSIASHLALHCNSLQKIQISKIQST